MELAHAGRQDSLSPAQTQEVENLSSAMSEASVGDRAEQTAEAPMSRVASNAPGSDRAEEQDGIDPRLLSNIGRQTNVNGDMGVNVVEMDTDEDIDQVETLALHGELDPTLDHETVAQALS